MGGGHASTASARVFAPGFTPSLRIFGVFLLLVHVSVNVLLLCGGKVEVRRWQRRKNSRSSVVDRWRSR